MTIMPHYDDEIRDARFPDGTTSHSTRLPNSGDQVAGYLPSPLPEGEGDKGRAAMKMQGLKQVLRQRIISERGQLPAALRTQFSVEIVRRIVQLPQYQSARAVLGYMNFGAEFESELWVRQALADGKTLLLPKVDRAANRLDVYRVTEVDTQLAPGAYGIREPVPERCVAAKPEDADFILLPGVAFGRDGARLGYGGGFYDRLLMKLAAIRLSPQADESLLMAKLQHRPALVAGAYAMQLVADIPQEPTDRKVEWLVTENETLHCAA